VETVSTRATIRPLTTSQELMDRICKISIHGRKSPLCNDRKLFNLWKKLSEERWADRKIILGIMYSESHIGANRAGTCNSSWNNRWGVKARVYNNGKVSRDQAIPNNILRNNEWKYLWWCRLYKFKDMQDYFQSKANMIWVNYKWCFNRNSTKSKVECISKNYVGLPNVIEQSWVNNVMSIAY